MRSRSRAGMAVFIVVMVSAVIGVFVAIVLFHGRDTRRKGVEKRDRAQAYFLARGAQSHFLLKLRLLPTELYHAVSYAVGKNPYFDFSIPVDSISGSNFAPTGGVALFGPMFFTGSTPGNITKSADGHIEVNRSAEGDSLYQNGDVGFGASAENRPRMEYLLNHYALDIASDFPDTDPNAAIVTFSVDPHKEVAQFGMTDSIGGTSVLGKNNRVDAWADPFTGMYLVRQIKILGSGGMATGKAGKLYNTDSVMVITEATVLKDKQVSLVTRVGEGLKPLVIQRDTKTSLKQEQGWLEVKEERESDADFKRRAVSGDRKSDSGKRTETCTEIYYVTRETKR